MFDFTLDHWHMSRALELAARGRGAVEPNPMVGCVIARGAEVVAEGWHQRYGGPHAEVEALTIAGPRAAGATLYVTLEPCCHYGKTPPCTEAVIAAGVARVVAAMRDPFPAVDGGGLAALHHAGIAVDIGMLEEQARRLNAPYLRLIRDGRPWVIAKWAMTLDGKLATRTGDSRWISGEASRAIVHELRGRVDGIMIGSRTAAMDDPLLTARPAGPRSATRIVVDSQASLASDSQLVRTAGDAPVLVAASEHAKEIERRRLEAAGCEVVVCAGSSHADRLRSMLAELGRRRLTNLLVEGGGQLLGTMFDEQLIDEVHVFIAPKVVGGAGATSIAGHGRELMRDALHANHPTITTVGDDVHVHAVVARD